MESSNRRILDLGCSMKTMIVGDLLKQIFTGRFAVRILVAAIAIASFSFACLERSVAFSALQDQGNRPVARTSESGKIQKESRKEIVFNRDVRPLLSETCFPCHGPDEESRQADLRLDNLEGATRDLGGYAAIVSGDVSKSELWERITSDDPDLLMPPPDSNLKLDEEQKSVLKNWIAQGAKYEGHWAFSPPQKSPVPEDDFELESRGAKSTWVRGAIDAFVASSLHKKEMRPSPEADARTLIRRLSFDLLGLPPAVGETRSFVKDYKARGEKAYRDLVERLLSSPHFGERMAVPWLDQARYADTNGYSIDGGRDMWLWRNWVIKAYNDNMPFDQFLTEQLAGDLIPNATPSQRIASGFNRNHMITHEGGTIPEENLTNYVADRVKTTSEVFLGLTMGCAQCHDHKYDPVSQKEYYEFFAFFNELGDRGLDGNGGVNSVPNMNGTLVLDPAERATVAAELELLRQKFSTAMDGFEDWLEKERKRELGKNRGFEIANIELLDASTPNMSGNYSFQPDGTVTVTGPSGGLSGFSHSIRLPVVPGDSPGDSKSINGIRIEFYPKEIPVAKAPQKKDSQPEEPEEVDKPNTKLALTPFPAAVPIVTTVLVSASVQPADQVDYHGQLQFSEVTASSWAESRIPGSVVDERNVQWWQPETGASKQHLTITFDRPVQPAKTPFLSVLLFFGKSNSMPFEWKVRAFYGNDTDSKWEPAIAAAIVQDPKQWDEATRRKVVDAFREFAPSLAPLRYRMNNLEDRLRVLTEAHSTMVMNRAKKPRATYVLNRGQYDAPTVQVRPRTPGVLPGLEFATTETDGGGEEIQVQPTRLDLARWMTRPDHPLTARVAVNRIWAIFFGTGLVATSADFGAQGEYPSHPELLDYLATEFVESGWDQKELIRKIVTSATYRQRSMATGKTLEMDPKNRWLSRGPRFRLPAEFIRDQALFVSGLLVRRLGGPSVQPYQPNGLWKEVSHFGSTPATKQVFEQDHGEKLYRRSLYTIVKRTSPHPAMAAFDAPNREMCVVDRSSTNTPIQALVTLNDPQFAEAARVFAIKVLQRSNASGDKANLQWAFEKVVSRLPDTQELEWVEQFLKLERRRYREHPDDATRVIRVGEAAVDNSIDPVEQAAWTQVAVLLFNLSEALTRN